jgi:hypothetical protein
MVGVQAMADLFTRRYFRIDIGFNVLLFLIDAVLDVERIGVARRAIERAEPGPINHHGLPLRHRCLKNLSEDAAQIAHRARAMKRIARVKRRLAIVCRLILAAPEVDVGGRQITDALVIASVVVVGDEGRDLRFEIARQVIVLEQDEDAVLERQLGQSAFLYDCWNHFPVLRELIPCSIT